MTQFKKKNLPLIHDKATPAGKLVIMTMLWKTLAFSQELKISSIFVKIMGFAMAVIRLLPDAYGK